jgi:chromosomal replication initiation ATPase DnaA
MMTDQNKTEKSDKRVVAIRGGKPTRPRFDAFVPKQLDPALEVEFLAQQARREALVRREQRKKNLESAPELELTDVMREALVLEVALEHTPSYDDARHWASGHPKPWLILGGGTGCGKSVAAAWILSQLGGIWMSAERIVRIFSAKFGDQYEEQELLRSCRLLFIDDIGTERDPLVMLSALIELMEARKSQRRRTVVTTNLPVSRFTARYRHERLISRMNESVHWCNSKHRDLRRGEPQP